MNVHRLERKTWVPKPLPLVFDFFACAENLAEVTPPWLHFKMLTPLPVEMMEEQCSLTLSAFREFQSAGIRGSSDGNRHLNLWTRRKRVLTACGDTRIASMKKTEEHPLKIRSTSRCLSESWAAWFIVFRWLAT